MKLDTPRLILQHASIGRLSALIHGPAEYEYVFGHKVEDGYIEYPDTLVFSLHKARDHADDKNWWLPFLMIHRVDGTLVGACGYNGPPDENGVVEIGYGIAPSYRGHGLTTEAAEAMIAAAFRNGGVRTVRALTNPEPNASTRILSKCGFVHAGTVDDPNEGPLWQWHLPREAHASAV